MKINYHGHAHTRILWVHYYVELGINHLAPVASSLSLSRDNGQMGNNNYMTYMHLGYRGARKA